MSKTKRICIKTISRILSILLLITCIYVPNESVYATQNKMSNYSNAFTLSGNGADDIVSVATAQIGKTGSQLGYSEEWCADFVGDCAALANQGNAIPRNGYCPSLQTAILNAGGQVVSVSSARKGDIVFYGAGGASHVEIVYANNNGTISTIGGNSGSGSNLYSRSVRNHSYQTMTITKVLRPNYGTAKKVLPGNIESGWQVPTTITATHRINTYNEYGNIESGHYIDSGDSCYIAEVYTNGFVKVQYPISNGKRWAYAKRSDFSLQKADGRVNLHAWFSNDKMGNEAKNIKLGEGLYLCYRMETADGNLLNTSNNYSIKETICYPNGEKFSYSYGNNNNWISASVNQWGTYRGTVEVSGAYSGKVEVSYTRQKPNQILLKTWFSTTAMGNEVEYLEKGKSYYMCYAIVCDNNTYFNQYANVDYSIKEEIFAPNGDRVYGSTYSKSDNNWIRFTATQSGTYKGVTTISGFFNASDTSTYVCKDMSTPVLQSIAVKSLPKKTTYYVGEKLDVSGLVVTAKYSNNVQKNVTNYKISGDTSKAGTKNIVISYTEGNTTKTCQFSIVVKEKPKEKVTLSYDPQGGTMSRTSQTGEKGTYCLIISQVPVKKIALTFDENGGNNKVSSKKYWIRGKAWKYNTGSISTYYKSGDKFLLQKNCTLTADYESVVINELPEIQKDGYVFDGWYTQNNQKAYVGMAIANDTKLIAHWKSQNITVTYYGCGGDWIEKKQTLTKNQSGKLIEEQPQRNCIITLNANGGSVSQSTITINTPFYKWYTSESKRGSSYNSGQFVKFENDVSLYASYESVKIGSLPTPEREGYEFKGWYLNNRYVTKNTIVSSDCTLEARWREVYVSDEENSDISNEQENEAENSDEIEDDDSTANVDNEENGDNADKTNTSFNDKQNTPEGDKIADDNSTANVDNEQNSDNTDKTNTSSSDKQNTSVGDKIEVNGVVYTVSRINKIHCVTLTCIKKQNKKIVIPDTIVYGGTKYKVTAIAGKAFYKNKNIKVLIIGKNVSKIGNRAFYGCKNLKKIIIKSEKFSTQNMGKESFSNLQKNVKVYVPKSKYKQYLKSLKKAGITSRKNVYRFK